MNLLAHSLVARETAAIEPRRIGPAALRNFTAERLAELIIQGIDRHGLRGLIYEADGLTDVVIHGKVDMLAVAKDVIAAAEAADREEGVPRG